MFSLIISNLFSAFAAAFLCLHVLFILWVIFGAALTRSRWLLQWLHIASLIWGVLTEILPWPCPLTFAENWLEFHAGVQPYQGGFLLHYLDALVYPNISPAALRIAAIMVCVVNLAIYARRFWHSRCVFRPNQTHSTRYRS